jgi:nucleoside-diphosphate-sugar epimerase
MVLITGGAGVVGSALVRRFVQAGESVRVLTLPGDKGADAVTALGAEVRFGDVSDAATLEGLCDGVRTVYHLAAVIIAFDDDVYRRVNVDGTANMLSVAGRAGVRHFVHVSSASVVYPRTTAYSRSKRVAEHLVQESGLDYTIVRPTLVYGTRGGEEFDQFLAYLHRFPVVPFIGAGKAKKRPVYVEDVIDGLAALHGASVALGKTYNLSGAESISIMRFARLCLELSGEGRKVVVQVPVWMCHVASVLMGAVMKRPPLRWPVIAGVTQDADLDPRSAVEEIGYRPQRVSEKLPECFPRT